jgi:hypothetical protein
MTYRARIFSPPACEISLTEVIAGEKLFPFIYARTYGITEQVQDNVRLDLAFLLQWNQDQDRPEFRDGTNAYFDVPVRKVITDAGAVLFVNNASSEHSKSVNNWGRSQFRFKFNKWKLIGGEHTYFIRQVSGEDFQAVILRESGPSIYRIVYKPAYLVSSRPGSGQMVPFVKASHWHIPGDTSSLGPGSVIAFKPIVAAIHWWQLEWRDCANGFANFLVEQGLVQSLAETCQEICHLAVKEWVDLLTDTTACAALSAYYKCCEGEPGYPYCWQPGSNTRKEYEAREPNEWTMASTGMRRWICAHTLLKIAQADLRPMPTGSIHAAIGDKIKVGYIWGDCKHSPRHMLDACHEQVPKEVWLSDTVLWVLVYPSVREDKAALGDYLKDRIDRGQPTADMGSHLEAGGDVILAEGAKQRFLYADELVGCLRSTDGKDEALESVAGRLQSTLMEALSDGA